MVLSLTVFFLSEDELAYEEENGALTGGGGGGLGEKGVPVTTTSQPGAAEDEAEWGRGGGVVALCVRVFFLENL